MKVAVLWSQLSGYLNGMLKALAAKPGVDLYVANEAVGTVAPYSTSTFDWMQHRYEYSGRPDAARLRREMEAFAPEVILAAWHVKAFQQCCLRFKGRAVTVACGDNQWSGSLRQRVASLTSSSHLRKYFDAIFVPGERQEVWARHMGFRGDQIWRGTFAPAEGFSAVAHARGKEGSAFIFAGRLAVEKGVGTLAKAYEGYARELTAEGEKPWDCMVAGTGPLAKLLGHPGFLKLGFIQPDAMPQLFAKASCFLLPSLYEPWGVALQEAAISRLPIICTRECGASVHMVQDSFNGFVVDAGNAGQLQTAMMNMTRLSSEEWQRMSVASGVLGQQFTPERWASTILAKGKELQGRLGLRSSA